MIQKLSSSSLSVFFLIPLILSVGISPTLQSSKVFQEANALKSIGNYLTEIGQTY